VTDQAPTASVSGVTCTDASLAFTTTAPSAARNTTIGDVAERPISTSPYASRGTSHCQAAVSGVGRPPSSWVLSVHSAA
jgi:hypothetical protein